MNDVWEQLLEFYDFLEKISTETNEKLRDNIEVKNIYNAICTKESQKEQLKKLLEIYPDINHDNLINIETMTLDECIIFFKRLYLSLRDSILEHDINIIYDKLISDMKQEEPFLFKNITKFIFVIKNSFKVSDIEIEEYYGDIPYVSYDETKKLISDFFGYIDPSNVIKNSFNNYVDSGNIYAWNKRDGNVPKIIQEKFPEYVHSKCFFYPDSFNTFINAPLNNDIGDAISLIHEFFHYYISKCEYGNNKILKEFPSIFLETVFVKYLINLGYDKKLLNKIYFYRLENHFETLSSLQEIWSLVSIKEKKQNLKIEDFIKKCDEEFMMKIIPAHFKKYENECLEYIRKINALAEEIARKKILIQIEELDCDNIFRKLSYLISKVFTDKILEKETDIKEAARKVLAVKDIITNNEMSFHYLLSYFELWDYYFLLENTDTYNPTIPKRIEDKQLVRK